ncbi:MAG: PIN domain nuclease [Thermoleophilaceae bacterium]|nr:PIN domain nuclease [Thermoleophilaceae bacterium]
MIVVDTSVWIDVINGADTPAAAVCVDLIESGQSVALTGVIVTEILQGFSSEREAEVVGEKLRAFPLLHMDDTADYELAARLYRLARAAGITVRNMADCLIAAPCVRSGVPILHSDADFDRLATCTALEIFPVG